MQKAVRFVVWGWSVATGAAFIVAFAYTTFQTKESAASDRSAIEKRFEDQAARFGRTESKLDQILMILMEEKRK